MRTGIALLGLPILVSSSMDMSCYEGCNADQASEIEKLWEDMRCEWKDQSRALPTRSTSNKQISRHLQWGNQRSASISVPRNIHPTPQTYILGRGLDRTDRLWESWECENMSNEGWDRYKEIMEKGSQDVEDFMVDASGLGAHGLAVVAMCSLLGLTMWFFG